MTPLLVGLFLYALAVMWGASLGGWLNARADAKMAALMGKAHARAELWLDRSYPPWQMFVDHWLRDNKERIDHGLRPRPMPTPVPGGRYGAADPCWPVEGHRNSVQHRP